MADRRQRSLKERLSYLKPYLDSVLEPAKIIWQDPLGRAGAIIFTLIVLIAVFAPLLATHNPHEMNERIEGSIIPFYGAGEWEDYEIIGEDPINDLATGQNITAAITEANEVIVRGPGGEWEKENLNITREIKAITISGEEILLAGSGGELLSRREGEWTGEDLPGDDTIYGISSSPAGEVLAVGEEGAIFLRSDREWRRIESGSERTLNAVNFSGAGDAVIVGDRGTIFHYREGELIDPEYAGFQDATFRDLLAVDYHASGMAFAVGQRGTIMGFDGESWSNMESDTSRELRGIAIFSEDSAFTVGYRGVMQQYDGEGWGSLDRITRRGYRGITAGAGDNPGIIYGVDPYVNELAAPSTEHFFGTTHLGRDIWSQVVYGSRTALMVGIIAALMVNILGFTVGLISGYYGGRVDSLLMRLVDIMYGMPLEPFAIVLVLIFDPGLWIIILAIGLLTWRTNARVIRSQVLSLAKRPFVKAARVAGGSNIRIMLVHIAPNVLPLAFLQLAVAMGYAITAEATLSFLGLGPPRVYSWGTILHAARLSGAWRTAWWWVIPPGIFISATVVSVFLISRAVEVLTNPRLRGGNQSAPEPEESEDTLPHGQ